MAVTVAGLLAESTDCSTLIEQPGDSTSKEHMNNHRIL